MFHCTEQKIKFAINDFFSKCDQIRITFTDHILREKRHFLCSVNVKSQGTAAPMASN